MILRSNRNVQFTTDSNNNAEQTTASQREIRSDTNVNLNYNTNCNEEIGTNETIHPDYCRQIELINLRLSRIEDMLKATTTHLQVPQPTQNIRFIAGDCNNHDFLHQYSYGEVQTHCGMTGIITDETATHIRFQTNISSEVCILTIQKNKFGLDGNFVVLEKV